MIEAFDFEYEPEESSSGKEGIVFFGQKGTGKTSAAYMLEGSKVVLSFDGKSLRVKELMRPDDEGITVFDTRKYLSHWKNQMTEGGKKTVEYVLFLLNETAKRGGCDWVIIDGLEMLIESAEMAMRFDHKVGPFDGVNMSYWRTRKMYIRAVHDAAFSCAKKGVVWTTYVDKDEIVNNATLVKRADIPKWMDIVMYETDAVVRTEIENINGREHFKLHVISSKIKRFKTGETLDVTGCARLEDATVVTEANEPIDLNKATARKKTRKQIKACPKCGGGVANQDGMLFCEKCDWVLEDEV